jgi:hypothetical protein
MMSLALVSFTAVSTVSMCTGGSLTGHNQSASRFYSGLVFVVQEACGGMRWFLRYIETVAGYLRILKC